MVQWMWKGGRREAYTVGLDDVHIEERDNLVELEFEQLFLIFLQERHTEAEYCLDAAREAIIEYSEDDLQRESVSHVELIGCSKAE